MCFYRWRIFTHFIVSPSIFFVYQFKVKQTDNSSWKIDTSKFPEVASVPNIGADASNVTKEIANGVLAAAGANDTTKFATFVYIFDRDNNKIGSVVALTSELVATGLTEDDVGVDGDGNQFEADEDSKVAKKE